MKRLSLWLAVLILGCATTLWAGTGDQAKKLQEGQIKSSPPSQVQVEGLPKDVDKLLHELGAHRDGEKIQVSLQGDVLFDFDKWNVKKEAEASLSKLVVAIKNLKVKEILIEGYTDSKGSEKYNLALSKRRAEAVRAWLVKVGGLTGTKIIAVGRGESNPVAPNTKPDGSDDPKGRAKNRRVEIFISLLED